MLPVPRLMPLTRGAAIALLRARRLELGLWQGDFDQPLAEALATLTSAVRM